MQVQTNWESQLLALAGHVPHPSTRPFFSYWAGDITLQKAYQRAAEITRFHSKSFYAASGLLPEEKRASVRALYAFCRTVDDAVDELKNDRDVELDYWREIVQTASAPTDDLVAAAWADTLTRYHIPRNYALQLIDGVARDLYQTRYQTFDDLATYCYGVASTVGLMSMYIVGFNNHHDAIPYAIKLGVALQMTNILRDVSEDHYNGRLYLPLEELTLYGIQECDIATGHVTGNWRRFMKFQIERTRQLYAESWQGVKMLEREGQLAIGAASVFYQGILDDIEKHDYNVFSRRASLNTLGKLSKLPVLWLKVKSL
jgi:15-cis-phytoene synthase